MTKETTTHVTTQVTTQVKQLLKSINNEMTLTELMKIMNLKNRKYFSRNYIKPALSLDLIEMTQADSPRSPKQKYQLTESGVYMRNHFIIDNQDKKKHGATQVNTHAATQVTTQVNTHVSNQVKRLIEILKGEMTLTELMSEMRLKNRRYFSRTYIKPSLSLGLIEMTRADSPRSPTQRYRLTNAGRELKLDMEKVIGLKGRHLLSHGKTG